MKDLDFNSKNQYLDLTKDYEGNIIDLLEESSIETALNLHNKLEQLLLTFFKPTDTFPNLGITIKSYLDKTYDYYITNGLDSETKNKYEKLNDYLQNFHETYELPGFAVGIIKNNRIVYAKGFGY